jgi:hypothetical protein
MRIVFGVEIAEDARASHFMQHGLSVKSAMRLFGGRLIAIACAMVFLQFTARAQNPGRQFFKGHVPQVVERLHLQPVSRLSSEKRLNLAIGLPLRNQQALDSLLQQIYDPASPNFRQYLTPEQFTEQFGPTEEDYQAVISFMESKGLTVTYRHPNRVVLDVSGSVADIEKAFQVTMRTYRHPTENRTFYAPDVEPSVDLAVPILQISGLDNYALPHPMHVVKPVSKRQAMNMAPNSGSGPSGYYMGNDFRAAYVPGVTLDGSGQVVGLLQFDGYYTNDIATYASQAGLTNIVTLTNVLLDGFSGTPTTDANAVAEVSLDIEMVISMAPGISKVIVYEAPNPSPWIDLLSRMANDNLAKQLSCSWGDPSPGSPNPTSEAIFKQMASQGQSFFNASGDSDAFTSGVPFPSESTNITQVGGTTLTTGSGSSYVSETVWNWGGGTGSSGGVSDNYSIPIWQQGISMTSNHGSTTMRNVPDVALTADNVYVVYNNGHNRSVGGTSCAAPLWAGFTALVNQQAVAGGGSTVGFINPAIYAIGTNANYTADFHDITTGNNTWSGSPTNFYAVPGYDLCTGWGTPVGQSLINALAGPPDTLVITPLSGFSAFGAIGGPFTVTSQNFLLTNSGVASLNWRIASTSSWLNVSSSSGTLAVARQTTVTMSLNSAASNLVAGTYVANVWFTNQTSGIVQNRQFTLQVVQPLVITPTTGFTASGPVGGPFNVTTQNLSLTNIGTGSLNWSIINTSLWLNASPTSGALPANGSTPVTVGLNSTANSFAAGIYTTSLWFSNLTSHAVQSLPFTLSVGQSLVQNGGFETGDFTDWTVIGRGSPYNLVDDGSTSGILPHSGTYFAALGQPGSLAYLSETLPTLAGQSYLLSLWMDSPDGETPNEFSVSWNGNTLTDLVNMPQLGWTNLQFIVTATGPSTVLQFGARDDPTYLGLDDVNVWPIPNPSFRSVAKSGGNAVLFSWNTFTNLAYQVQYSTNLAKTNWIILSTNTATGPILTLTNSYGTNPQRFYRIRWLH